ncbi:transposase [Streptococcus varani]|uniref:Transposase n=1 Tax=Streptococcus varani TaxID=1608583 RepID=A0A0E3WER8_9STRE|nr:IS110 family transposase [Streptococcus varani]CQR24032.1 transposase [Streptococcus varani]CQR24176.1 transposase [Streptococcus varani]CQR24366.1 transposase [Streptococcus varani]CQR24817.1 transposase [Streptococcus varani]CQR25837.1 transposase [Streptococcus varani]
MEVMIETCCGIDVHQKSIVCCILDGPLDTNKPKKIQKKFGTTTVALQNALAWLEENRVTHVFFESTGQYWLPLFNIFSDSDLVLVLANPQHIKNVPGRKTDVKDAEWIAQLGRCGLISLSYIPSPEVMQLRLLTRRLRSYKQRQTQVKNEIHNLLQRANIKLTSYLSDIFSKTGQSLLTLFINGEVIDCDSVSACLHKHVKASPEELVEAMNGKLSLEDRFLLNQSLEEYRMYQELMDKLTSEIQTYIAKEFP